MNKIILVGNIANDIELRYTKDNRPVATFHLAVSRIGEGTDFLPIVVWGKLAENVYDYCQKGSKILVEGRVQTRTYDNNSEKRYITEVLSERIEFLSKKEKPVNGVKNSVLSDDKKDEFKEFGEHIKTEIGEPIKIEDSDLPF